VACEPRADLQQVSENGINSYSEDGHHYNDAEHAEQPVARLGADRTGVARDKSWLLANPSGNIDLVFIFSGNAQMCGHGLPRQGNFDIRVQIAPGENVEGWTANAMLPEALGQK